MSYVYIRSEPSLWTVGFYKPDGKWEPESDHGRDTDAAKRVAWLNGSGSRLTGDDRFLIAEARRIAPALQARISDTERLAGEVIDRLADLAERLGGEDS